MNCVWRRIGQGGQRSSSVEREFVMPENISRRPRSLFGIRRPGFTLCVSAPVGPIHNQDLRHLMKRIVVVLTVSAMALAGLLGSVVLAEGSASAAPAAAAAHSSLASASAIPGSFTPLPVARIFDGKLTMT